MVPVVSMFGKLSFSAILAHRLGNFADIVMGTNEDEVIGVIEEMFDRLDFRRACCLTGAQRVETNDYDAIDAVERAIEGRHCAIIGDAFDLNDFVARQRFRLFGEGLEIRLLDVVQKSADSLINFVAVRQ